MSTDDTTLDLDPTFRPEAVRQIADVDAMRAISDPTRIRILETMVQRQEPAWSVKELAAALGLPQTRLYHHVELLVQHGLVRAVERRVVSGIIETRYRVAALSFQLDRRLFTGDTDEARGMIHDTLVAVFDSARDEIEAAVRAGIVDPAEDAPDELRMLMSRGLTRLTPARAAEYRRRLVALIQEFDQDDDPAAVAYGVVVALYPMPHTTESDHG